jgi:hypothetical protein
LILQACNPIELSKYYVREENINEGIKFIIEFSQEFGSSVRDRKKRNHEKKTTNNRPLLDQMKTRIRPRNDH